MKIKYLIFIFGCCGLFSFSQEKHCGFNHALNSLFHLYPEKKALFEKIIREQQDQSVLKTNALPITYTIPVVFHVLHLGGAENISDSQMLDALAILNRDYRKLNQDTNVIVNEFKTLAADTKIEFRLATKDPNGNCTSGITRHYDSNTDWNSGSPGYNYTWPSAQYLNIYVVRSLDNGAAAYTYLPGLVPASWDAIVAIHSYVGSMGTSNNYTSRALTHECGHWLGLQHTWGSTNNPGVACGDDAVNDTPITKGHYSCNLNNGIVCTPGVVENIQNYMEYSYCSRMFTVGQANRMQNTLITGTGGRNNLYTNSNLLATGVMSPALNCIPKPAFIANASITCVGNSVTFVDQSYNAPVSNWKWSSNLSSLSSTSQAGTLTFTSTGIANVKLKVSNQYGSDSLTKAVVLVLAGPTASGNINETQGFENQFPGNNWIISQPQYGSGFVQTTLAASGGYQSAWVNNYFDNPNGPVNIFSPSFNFQNVFAGQLDFKYAYAQQSASNNDRFRVYATSDCASSWDLLYNSNSISLNTSGGPVAGPFTPGVSSQWRSVSIPVSMFSSNPSVIFRFEFTPDPNGAGNNFYIDDINLSTSVGMREQLPDADQITIFPIPFQDELTVNFGSDIRIDSFTIRDITGREIFFQSLKSKSKVFSFLFVNGIPSGIYLAEIKTERGIYYKKIIRK